MENYTEILWHDYNNDKIYLTFFTTDIYGYKIQQITTKYVNQNNNSVLWGNTILIICAWKTILIEIFTFN